MNDTNQKKLGTTLWGIADCFTGVDDLITAQSQKLAALKTHKQGLMQQLFPSPETQNTL